jgi:4a-hydroxytetrahydrobiopterin dehydratase
VPLWSASSARPVSTPTRKTPTQHCDDAGSVAAIRLRQDDSRIGVVPRILFSAASSAFSHHVSLGEYSGTVGNMAVLTDEEVDAALPDLDGWKRADGALRRSIKFPSFLAGIDMVRRVAEHAESKDHHPDIDIRWRTVTFALVTHSEGGITKNDIAMARDIDGIVAD